MEEVGCGLKSSEPSTGAPGVRRKRRQRRRAPAGRRAQRDLLTRRQWEVLRLVATGLTNKGVANQLGLSIHTVEAHLHAIYIRLGVTTRGAAIRFAVEHGVT
jgi:DNA-binding NarL/FixJ family response regulator